MQFILEVGDALVCNTDVGSLVLVREGELDVDLVDLTIRSGSTEGSALMGVRTHDVVSFLHLAGTIAILFGLSCNEVIVHDDGFTAVMKESMLPPISLNPHGLGGWEMI